MLTLLPRLGGLLVAGAGSVCSNCSALWPSNSLAFFKALGFSQNPQFTDDAGACVVVSDTILVMLLSHARFRDFTPKDICDTSKAVEVLLAEVKKKDRTLPAPPPYLWGGAAQLSRLAGAARGVRHRLSL